MRGMDIKELVADFNERLHALVDQISMARAREAVMHALGEKRGRLPRGLAALLGRKPRRKGPRQLCPVPGCTNPAAPVFGMVCGEHKDVSKTKIKQYREARRAAKLSAKKGGQGSGKTVGKTAGKKEARVKASSKGATTSPRARRSKRATRQAAPPAKTAARPAKTPASPPPARSSAPAPASESSSASLAN